MRPEDTTPNPNVRSPSTTWDWRHVIIQGAPPLKTQRAVGARSEPLRARDPRKPITVEVEYRGGPEGKFRIRARGRTWHFTGDKALIDVMAAINATLRHEDR